MSIAFLSAVRTLVATAVNGAATEVAEPRSRLPSTSPEEVSPGKPPPGDKSPPPFSPVSNDDVYVVRAGRQGGRGIHTYHRRATQPRRSAENVVCCILPSRGATPTLVPQKGMGENDPSLGSQGERGPRTHIQPKRNELTSTTADPPSDPPEKPKAAGQSPSGGRTRGPGRPPKERKLRKYTVQLDPEAYEFVQEYADEVGLPTAAVLRKMVIMGIHLIKVNADPDREAVVLQKGKRPQPLVI